ncbi:low molecular weight protein-tyrosine-phosphatase [Candidatus Riflebacteria bacterium]
MALKVLFVCLGNICRSPLAHGYLEYLAKDLVAGKKLEVDSAGLLDLSEGDPPQPMSQKVALEEGFDISMQYSRPITCLDFKKFDLIIAMDNSVYADLKRDASSEDANKLHLFLDIIPDRKGCNIPDPMGGSFEDFRNSFSLIKIGIVAWIQKIKADTVNF